MTEAEQAEMARDVWEMGYFADHLARLKQTEEEVRRLRDRLSRLETYLLATEGGASSKWTGQRWSGDEGW